MIFFILFCSNSKNFFFFGYYCRILCLLRVFCVIPVAQTFTIKICRRLKILFSQLWFFLLVLKKYFIFALLFGNKRPVRLGVRTQGFHPCNRGSNPLRATKQKASNYKLIMAHHKSAKKRIRSNNAKRLRNRYYAKTARSAVRKLRATKEKEVALESLPQVISLVDKLAKRSVIHKNKASNLKSSLMKHVNHLQ